MRLHTHTNTHTEQLSQKSCHGTVGPPVALPLPQPSPPLCQVDGPPPPLPHPGAEGTCEGYCSGKADLQCQPTHTQTQSVHCGLFPCLSQPTVPAAARCPPARASLMSHKGCVWFVIVYVCVCVCVFKGTEGLA